MVITKMYSMWYCSFSKLWAKLSFLVTPLGAASFLRFEQLEGALVNFGSAIRNNRLLRTGTIYKSPITNFNNTFRYYYSF